MAIDLLLVAQYVRLFCKLVETSKFHFSKITSILSSNIRNSLQFTLKYIIIHHNQFCYTVRNAYTQYENVQTRPNVTKACKTLIYNKLFLPQKVLDMSFANIKFSINV